MISVVRPPDNERKKKEKLSTTVGHFAGSLNEGSFRISFFHPFYSDYRIIWLLPEYDLALVTGGDRSSLWILARDKSLSGECRYMLVKTASY